MLNDLASQASNAGSGFHNLIGITMQTRGHMDRMAKLALDPTTLRMIAELKSYNSPQPLTVWLMTAFQAVISPGSLCRTPGWENIIKGDKHTLQAGWKVLRGIRWGGKKWAAESAKRMRNIDHTYYRTEQVNPKPLTLNPKLQP